MRATGIGSRFVGSTLADDRLRDAPPSLIVAVKKISASPLLSN